MVDIIKEKTFGSEFGRALGGGLGEGFAKGAEEAKNTKQRMVELAKENKKIYEDTGIILTSTNQKMREKEFSAKLKAQNDKELLDQKYEKKNDLIKDIYGNKQNPTQDFGNQINPKEKLPSFMDQLQNEQTTSQDQMNIPDEMQNQNEGGFDASQLTDEQIARAYAADHDLGAEMRAAKNAAIKQKNENRKHDLDLKKISPEHQRQQHLESAQAQADVKYNQQLQEASKQHALKEQTLNRLEKLNQKGVTGKPYEKLLEKSGLVAFTSDGRREFAADVKNLITDIRSILGAQFTGFEFQTILNAYPSADFSKGANEAIIKNLKDFQDIKSKEVEFSRDIKKENGGKIPQDFQSLVNERVHEYAVSKIPDIKANTMKIMNEEYGIKPGYILMFDPNGEPLNVPEDRMTEALDKGASLP